MTVLASTTPGGRALIAGGACLGLFLFQMPDGAIGVTRSALVMHATSSVGLANLHSAFSDPGISTSPLPGWARNLSTAGRSAVCWAPPESGSRWVVWGAANWLQRLVSLPRAVILSSRLGRRLDHWAEWFAAMRQLMADSSANVIWLTHPGMTADRCLERAPANFGATVIRLVPALPDAGPSVKCAPAGFDAPRQPGTLYYAPWEKREPRWPARRRRWVDDPDRWLIPWAQRIELLRVRRGSRLPALILDRVTDGANAQVRFARHPRLLPRELQQRLASCGAEAWELRGNVVGDGPAVHRKPVEKLTAGRQAVAARKLVPTNTAQHARWLMHWTRSCHGPWPGQSEAAYLDDLIWGRPESRRGPLATLLRILQDNRIRASAAAIRGGHPVVCFAHWRWSQLQGPGIYRRARGRWDRLPYGLAFRPEVLLRRGARPVVYGADVDWKDLPAGQRFRFQRAESRQGTDWREECEWRMLGDLDLSGLGPTDAVVFAPGGADLETLRRLSRWPIQIIEPDASSFDVAG